MNPLLNVIPAKARKYVYAGIALVAFLWSVYEATGGNWKSFVAGIVVALSHSVAASNTDVFQPQPDGPQDQ